MASYEEYSLEFKRDVDNLQQNDEYDHFIECIQFFKNSKRKKNPIKRTKDLNLISATSIDKPKLFELRSFFATNHGNDYQRWIKDLVLNLISSELLTNEMLINCLNLFENNLILCEMVFPYLIRTILLVNSNLAKPIGTSFKEIFEIDFNCTNNGLSMQDITRCLKLFIGTIDFLRTHSKKVK